MLYFCRIKAHVPISHPLFEALRRPSQIWTFYWRFFNTESSFFFFTSERPWCFYYFSFRADPGSKVSRLPPDYPSHPSPKPLLSLQEHVQCVRSGVWKISRIKKNLGGNQWKASMFLPSYDLCARLWWEMCALLVVDDVSPQVTIQTYDMDENALIHLVTDTVVEMLYIDLVPVMK